MPSRQIDVSQGNEEVFAAYTGPNSGLTAVNLQQKHLSISDTDIDYIDMLDQNEQYRSGEFRTKTLMKQILMLLHNKNVTLLSGSTTSNVTIAGITDWFNPHENAYGIATTLYEKNPTNNTNNGEPIADCFGIVARPNSAILALADGVNWGKSTVNLKKNRINWCVCVCVCARVCV